MAIAYRLTNNFDGIILVWVFLPALFLFPGGITIKELKINEEIRDKEVRLIGENGDQLGVVSNKDAQDKAFEAGLDLVCVSPNAKPPVCKLMDYGKYRYDLIKKQREAQRAQVTMNVKEVRMSPQIELHDLNTKAKQAERFLKAGDRVKVSVRFRGREMGHTELGREVLDDLVEILGDLATIEVKPKMEGRNMVMFLVPNTDK